MSINDPLGDMLARIRNAQMRHKTKVTTPASSLREHVLDVLVEEGFIRGYARVDYAGGRSEFDIELKYFDGEPVIKDIKRDLDAGTAGVFLGARSADGGQRAWRLHTLDAERRHVGFARPHRECGRRDSLQRFLGPRTKGDFDVAYRQKTGGNPEGRHRVGERPGGRGEGTEGRAQARPRGRRHRQARRRQHRGCPARGHAECARHVGHVADAGLRT